MDAKGWEPIADTGRYNTPLKANAQEANEVKMKLNEVLLTKKIGNSSELGNHTPRS